jgi:hypothetical protein
MLLVLIILELHSHTTPSSAAVFTLRFCGILCAANPWGRLAKTATYKLSIAEGVVLDRFVTCFFTCEEFERKKRKTMTLNSMPSEANPLKPKN